MIETIHAGVSFISGILYQPWCVPLLLVASGIYFSIRCRLIQLTMLKEALKVISDSPENEHGISSFGALMVSTASRVGTGNIIGVSTALCIGGAGSIFWMWITAFLGGSTAFIESTLAQIYKKKNPDGSSYGGPAFYMQDALHQRWMGVIFSVLIILIYAVGYNMLAAYNLQSAFMVFSFYSEKSTPIIIGLILAIAFGIIIFGGARRLSRVTEFLVPIMGVIYVAVALFALLTHFADIPKMLGMIFANAFDLHSILGGFTGSCIMWGIKRGLYSNEAGMGSAPNAAATADVSHPAKQGFVQMISVFLDTLLICTATAFMCLISGVTPEESLAGAAYVQNCMGALFGVWGPIFLTFALSLFAFTTLIGNYSYCEGCLEFIIRRKAKTGECRIFRLLAAVIVLVGAIMSAGFVWDTADMLQGLIVVVNVPSILLLGGTAVKCLEDYKKQFLDGKNPVFKAEDIGLKEKTDFWN